MSLWHCGSAWCSWLWWRSGGWFNAGRFVGFALTGPFVFPAALVCWTFASSLHGAFHVDRVLCLVLVLLRVELGLRPMGPAQLVGVGVDTNPLVDHVCDLIDVRGAIQIEPKFSTVT